MKREKLIQLIHVARSHTMECQSCGSLVLDTQQCMCGSKTFKPISEMRYRNSLEQLTGKRSCSELTEEQLQKVYNLFKSIGFKTVQTRFDPAREQSRALRNIRASITDRAPDILGSSWERRLQGFIRKMGKEDLSFCDHNELRKVQGFLSREEKKEKEKAE